MKATITGATGHVGATLARALIAHGHEVRAIVRSEGRGLAGLDIEKIGADVSDPESLRRAFLGSDVVFHAAARISISRSDTKEVVAANLDGTRNVIAACRRASVRRLVHFSSIEAIDPRPFHSPVDENRPFVDGRAGSPYAVSKALAEAEVRRAVSEGLDAVILNPTAIIGPHDFKPSLLGRALLAFARGSLPMLIDGGFDWVDVRDVAEAAVAAAECAPTGGRYIVGGRWASMAELARFACDAAGARIPRLVCPFGLARAWAPLSTAFCRLTGRAPLFTSYSLKVLLGNRCVSHARAQRDLGYGPRDLEQTVRETLIWFRENGYLEN
jgi:dihydroflavonol-4-reductase